MDVKHVLYRFAFTIYSKIGREFQENAVYSPYLSFISTIASAAISPDEVVYSNFIQFAGLTENLSSEEVVSILQNIIQNSETIPVSSPYFIELLNQFSKKENNKDIAFNYMKLSEQYLMFTHIKNHIIESFPDIKFDSDDTLFLHFSDYYNAHKKDKKIQNFLKSIEVPILRLRKAPTVISSNLIYINTNNKRDFQSKLTEVCSKLRIDLQSSTFPQPAVDQINQTIDEHTNGMIKQILTEESVEKDIDILNVNSILFDAKWEKNFSAVDMQDFHLYSGEKRKIKTMILRHKKCNYFENENIQVLQLNYACSHYSMVYILNKNSQSVQISNNELEKAIDSLKVTDVYMEIPRFEAEFGPASIDSCFPPDLCKDANKNYMKIIQKVKIGNYEEGTSPTPPDKEKRRSANPKTQEKDSKNEKQADKNEEVENREESKETLEEKQAEQEATLAGDQTDKNEEGNQNQASQNETKEICQANQDLYLQQIRATNISETQEVPQATFLTENSVISSNESVAPSVADSQQDSMESRPLSEVRPESKNNRINTATSPTTSSTDIHITSPPLSPAADEEAAGVNEEEDEEDGCDRNGAEVEFLCNHPFLFFVINRASNVILFMGTITDPVAVDLQPLTVEQRTENFLASIRGDELPFPPKEEEGIGHQGSIWDEIEQIGDSVSNDQSDLPPTPKEDEVVDEKKDDEKVDDQIGGLESKIDNDLLEYVYEGKPKPPPNKKMINHMFGYESKKKKTFSSFSPWSNVVFYKAKSALSPYKAIEKPKYPREPRLPPLPPLSDLSTTNWDELEKELEESGMPALHSSAIKKNTPKLVEPKPNAVLSLRTVKKKRF